MPAKPGKELDPDEQEALDRQLQSLIYRYGAIAVRDTTKRLGKQKRGRKPEPDLALIGPIAKADARDWLDGRQPFALRSNYAIATELTAENPGHNAASTHRRIMGKLAKRREWMVAYYAWQISEKERPYADYFRAVEFLAEKQPSFAQTVFAEADTYRGKLERYREIIGEPPADMTIKEIHAELDRRFKPALTGGFGGNGYLAALLAAGQR